MNNNYCIYIITNKINNKIYIGKTLSNPKRRWKDHIRVAQSEDNKKQYIHRALAKYGVENFSFDILKFFNTEKQAYIAEKKYIKKYNSYGDGGYNETCGGEGFGDISSARTLTDKQARNLIRDYIYTDMVVKGLCIKYKISKPSALDILNRRAYLNVKISENMRYQLWLKLHRNIYKNMDHSNCNFLKIDPAIIVDIFNDFITEKYNYTQLARKYNISIGNLKFILERKTHLNTKIKKSILKKAIKLMKNRSVVLISKKEREIIKTNIFIDFKNKLTKKEIAIKNKISEERVVKILNLSIWKNISIANDLIQFKTEKRKENIDKEIALNIIKYYCSDLNINIADVSKALNINKSIVKNVLQRNTFNKINVGKLDKILFEKIKKEIKFRNFEEDDIINIFSLFAKNNNMSYIGRMYNVSHKIISAILHRKTYKDIIINKKILNITQELLK